MKKKCRRKRRYENRLLKLRSSCHIQRMTRLLHLALKCITFTVGHFTTFSVKLCMLHLRLGKLLHLALNFITFTVGITFSVNLCHIYGWYYISSCYYI